MIMNQETRLEIIDRLAMVDVARETFQKILREGLTAESKKLARQCIKDMRVVRTTIEQRVLRPK